jgi:hypothetical protein
MFNMEHVNKIYYLEQDMWRAQQKIKKLESLVADLVTIVEIHDKQLDGDLKVDH